jgi:hypothetical protein
VTLAPIQHKWIGKQLRDTQLGQWLDVDQFPQDGEWILFRYTCDHCRDHFIKLNEQWDPAKPKMYVLVHIPDQDDQKARQVEVLPPHFEPIAELPAFVPAWIGETPWTLELEGGIVKRAYLNEGEKEDSAKLAPPPVEKK